MRPPKVCRLAARHIVPPVPLSKCGLTAPADILLCFALFHLFVENVRWTRQN
jgi:hypothetical protein